MSTKFAALPCAFCKHPSADQYCGLNENYRTCSKYSTRLSIELLQARSQLKKLTQRVDHLLIDLNCLDTGTVSLANIEAKRWLDNNTTYDKEETT